MSNVFDPSKVDERRNGEHSGWFKSWPNHPEELDGCSFLARCVAAGIHAHLDDCGGLKVDVTDPIGSLAKRFSVPARERMMFWAKMNELTKSGYIEIVGSRLWVPSWAWQQRDKNGVVEDLYKRYAIRRSLQRQGATRDEVGSEQGATRDEVGSEQGATRDEVGSEQGSRKHLKSLKSQTVDKLAKNKLAKKKDVPTACPSPSSDVTSWFSKWQQAFDKLHDTMKSEDRVCIEKAFERHGFEKCVQALEGYAADPWRHQDSGRHKVSVILGSGGTTKPDKVLLGLEKYDDALKEGLVTRPSFEDPGEDVMAMLRYQLILANEDARAAKSVDEEWNKDRFRFKSWRWGLLEDNVKNEIVNALYDNKSFPEAVDQTCELIKQNMKNLDSGFIVLRGVKYDIQDQAKAST